MSVSIGAAIAGAQLAAQGAKALGSTLNIVGGKLNAAKAKSYIEYSKVTTIEPPTLVDESIASLPIITSILQSLNTQFTLYYIQAATIHVNLGRINIAGKLDPLNPNRTSGMPSFPSVSLESEEEKPFLEFGKGICTYNGTGLEDFKLNISPNAKTSGTVEFGNGGGGVAGSTDKIVKDTAVLSVGKVFDFEIHDGDKTAKIPLTCRLRTGVIKPEPLTRLLSLNQLPRGFFARIKGFYEGDLEFWRDVVLNKDLIKEHRDTLLKDTTGMYKERLAVARKNKWAAITRLEPSIATLATMYVVSKDTLLSMATQHGVDFSRPKVREKVFEASGAMIIAEVDTRYETVNFYYHSLEAVREFTFSQIQRESSNGKGSEVSELIQAMGLLQPGRI